MALKDWKKTNIDKNRGELYSRFNNKLNMYITIFYLPRYNPRDTPYSISYEIIDERENIDKDWDEFYSNKKAALKKAINYMRKH